MKSNLSHHVQLSAEYQAGFFRVLGNPQRVMILWLVSEQARTANEIALAIGSSPSSTLHHLRILEFNNLLVTRSERNIVYYHLADNEITRNCLVFKSKPKEMLMEINQN